jgi:hypothetical protein
MEEHSDAIFRNPRRSDTALHTRRRAVASQADGALFEIKPHHTGISVPNLEESIARYQKSLASRSSGG